MAASKDSFLNQNGRTLPDLPVTGVHEQYRRQRISDDWEPNGFQRFAYNQRLLRAMPVLGGPDDNFGANPDRYTPVSPTMEVEWPIHTEETTKKKTT